MGTVILQVKSKKAFAPGETVTVLVAVPDGHGGLLWFVLKGTGAADGSLILTIPAATAQVLAGKVFITTILE